MEFLIYQKEWGRSALFVNQDSLAKIVGIITKKERSFIVVEKWNFNVPQENINAIVLQKKVFNPISTLHTLIV